MTASDSAHDVLEPAETLAHILKEDPYALDRETQKRGEQFLVIFSDPNFGKSTKNLNSLKIGLLKQAILDLSSRGKVLSQAYLGITFFENQLSPFMAEYGEVPSGNVVFKVGLKNSAAFQNWRNGAAGEVTQDDLNAGIYRLTVEWSACL